MGSHVVIVGLGLIGGSLAKAFSDFTDCSVTAMDTDPTVLKKALEDGAISQAGTPESLCRADYVFLCLYPQAAVDFIRRHGEKIPSSCIVADTCGIKEEICRQMPPLAQKFGFTFIGFHPMAGKERSGYAASEAYLFQGASCILTPCGAPKAAVEALKNLLLRLGFGQTVLTTPQEHDRMIAFTSQLPHVLACAYVLSPQCPNHKGFSAGSYRDVSRVARINEVLWSELFLDNAQPLTAELDLLLENLTSLRNAIAAGDGDTLRSLLQKGREIKESLGE